MSNLLNKRFRLKRKYEFLDSTVKQLKCKTKGEDEEEEEEEEENEPRYNPLELINKKNEMIYRTMNHVYFRSYISFESINKLGKLIDEINNEYELILRSMPGVKIIPKPIYLHITSEGGLILAGLLGSDMIRNSKIPIYTVVEGRVVSSGTLLSIVGKKRLMTENSYVLIHQLSSAEMGNFEQLKDCYKNNGQLMKHIKSLYTTYTKLNAKQLDEVLKHDIYWNYEKAQKVGLVDDVYKPDIVYKTTDDVDD